LLSLKRSHQQMLVEQLFRLHRHVSSRSRQSAKRVILLYEDLPAPAVRPKH